MTIKQKLEKLALENNPVCVTISLNTHKTHPDNQSDIVLIKNLLSEAKDRVINEFGKRDVANLLENIASIDKEIDVNYNLDSLHIFLSNDTKEIIRSSWGTNQNSVHISDSFNIRSLIKSYNRSQEYYILLLSQSGVHLYSALNEMITDEVKNEDFPYPENNLYSTHKGNESDPKHQDNIVREFLNRVDKAVMKIHNDNGLRIVVICTEDNYSRLMQVTDNANVYYGYVHINYNNTTKHHISIQGWNMIKNIQQESRKNAISEIKEAVSTGKVFTDLQEIYQASIDGNGDLLIVNSDFEQPVKMTSDRTFELITDKTQDGAIDDIVSRIAWNVMSKKGRVIFTASYELSDLGSIVLKTRY
jgi:hypothetical protein